MINYQEEENQLLLQGFKPNEAELADIKERWVKIDDRYEKYLAEDIERAGNIAWGRSTTFDQADRMNHKADKRRAQLMCLLIYRLNMNEDDAKELIYLLGEVR